MKVDIPGDIPRIVEKASDAYFEFTQLRPGSMVENSPQEFRLLSSDYTIYTSSKKHGRLIYNKNWDLVTKLYEVKFSMADKSNESSLYSTALKSHEVRSDEIFHGAKELRKR